MPIKRAFNDPVLGQAFSNISELFGPPSGSDLAGYATASAKKQEAARLAELFAAAKDEATKKEIFDRMGMATGQWTPSTGYYGVDTKASTDRYSTDRSFDASRLNNTADNQRALATNKYTTDRTFDASRLNNADDNARAITTTGMTNQKDITTSMLAPVAAGATRFVPPSIAEMYKTDQTQTGVLSANPGEKVVAPNGQVLEGSAKPLSETEWQAAQNERLRAAGKLTDQDMLDVITGKQSPVQAVGPGGKPVFMTPGAATRQGAEAYVDPKNAVKPTNGEAILPDGSKVPVNQGLDGIWKTQDGQPIPAGSRVTNMATPQGSNLDIGAGPKTTEAQDKNAYAVTMAEPATKQILTAFDTGQLPSQADYQIFNAMRNLPMAAAPALVQNMSPAGQAFYQNIRVALPYQLMSQSGQAVTEQEYERKLLELIPIPGEDPAVSSAKRQQFELYVKAARGVAGPAYDKVHGPDNVPASPAIPTSQMPNAPQGGDPLSEARAAIAKGAPRDAVIQRLQKAGINPEGL